MPPTLADFPVEVQWAFFIYEKIPDKIDSMGGIYLGKDWSCVPVFFHIYEVENRKAILDLLFLIDKIYKNDFNKKAEAERKKQDRAMKAQVNKKN